MYKIYTPKARFSIFGYPSLFVEDDGLIYSEKDYLKTSRNPVGKIDFDSGFVYGEDYHRLSRQPIAKLDRRSDGVIQIYGSDYYKLSAQPVYYIKEDRIYSADEFFKLLPREEGYIETVQPKTTINPPPTPPTPPTPPQPPKPPKDPESEERKKMIWTVAIVAFFMVAATIWVFTDVDYAKPTVIMLIVGAVLSLIFAKSYPGCVITTLCTCGVIMFIYDFISTSSHKTLGTGELIISILLYPFAICLSYLIPSLLVGGLVWLVKRPFLKKKETKKEESETK